MKRNMLKIFSMAVSLTMILSLAACGSSEKNTSDTSTSAVQSTTENTTKEASNEKVTLKMLVLSGDEIRKNIADKIEKGFTEAFPGYSIELERGGGAEDYNNKLKTYNAIGELPDVFWANSAPITEPILSANGILDLSPYVTKDGFLDKYTTKPAPYNEKYYVMNAGTDEYFVPRIFYHKSLFQKYNVAVPKTFDEFLAAAKVFKDNGIIPVATVAKDGWTFNTQLFQNMVMSEDPQAIKDLMDNKTDFNNKAIVAAINKIQTMTNEGVFQDGLLTMEYGAVQDLFVQKKAAMYTQFTWGIPDLVKADPDGDIDFMPYPQSNESVDREKLIQIWGGPLNGYAVSSYSKNPDAAVKLLEYAVNTEALFWNVDQKSPTTYNTGEKLSVDPLMQKHLDNYAAAEKIVTFSNYSLNAKATVEFNKLATKVFTGKYSGEDFAKDFSSVYAEQFNK